MTKDEILSTRGEGVSQSLYVKEDKVYPKAVEGVFARLRNIAMVVLLGLFYGVVWLKWDARQAVLFDLPARKFYVFGWTFWPQDFIYLALLLIIAGLSLFFFTALAGRLWCGYACPQTVWTEAFLWMERLTEGDRNKRMKLDRGPWNANRILRKGTKQFLWITFALWTGFTFVGYFTPVRELAGDIVALNVGPWATFWLLFYGFATYGNAGFLREQVCKYMCPYARFQSAMFDKDTLVISYDDTRGEPRGSRKKSADPHELGLGECIDCTLCVQVCPTGIDIREGLQEECIACAACIDACDEVMVKMNYPKGLVRYTTQNALHGKNSRVVRPRLMIYGVLLASLLVGLMISIGNRTPLRMEVVRDRNALYRELADQRIENVYTVRAINMTESVQTYELEVSGLAGLEADIPSLEIRPGEAAAFPVRLQAARATQTGSVPIQFLLRDADEPDNSVVRDSKFFFPFN